jgi:LCP family protein required for cell wall assembly
LIFGILAYGILQFAFDAFSLEGNKGSVGKDPLSSTEDTTEEDNDHPNLTPLKGESFTVLFIGTDFLPDVYNDYEYTDQIINGFPAQTREVETDTLILLRVNKETGECIFCPIPALAEVTVDGHKTTLEKVYSRKGIDELLQHVNYLTGIPVDYYALVTIENLSYLIDDLGGVEFYVPENMHYVDLEAQLEINILKGTTILNGKTATDMLRYWSYKDEDVSRRRVASDFLKALATKVMTDIPLKDAAIAYLKYQDKIETNFTVSDLTSHSDLIYAFSKMNIIDITYPGKTIGTGIDARFIPNITEAYKLFDKYKFKG